MLLLKLIERLEKCFDLTENPDVRKDSLSSENVEKIRGRKGKQQLESLQRIRNVDDKQGLRRGWGWGGFPTFWLIKSLFFFTLGNQVCLLQKKYIYLIRRFIVYYRWVFLRVVPYFHEPVRRVKIQTTSKNSQRYYTTKRPIRDLLSNTPNFYVRTAFWNRKVYDEWNHNHT